MPSGYTRLDRALTIAACILGIGTFSASANQSWQSIKLDAERLSTQRNFQAAIPGYQRALQLCPPGQENDRADMQLALATAYKNLMQIDKAVAILDDARVAMIALKNSGRLDPQVLVSLQTLIETCDKGFDHNQPYDVRTKAKTRMTEAINKICQEVYPQGLSTKRKLAYARTFLSNDDLPGAYRCLEELEKNLKRGSPSDSQLYKCEWSMAAVEQRMGKPQALLALQKRLQKTHSEAFTLVEVANAQLWAANYEEAKRSLDRALSLLKIKPNRDDKERVCCVYIEVCKDLADFKGEEVWQRKRLALFKPDEAKYQGYAKGLAHCLRRLHRFDDADKLSPQKGHHRSGVLTEWEWFLTDKEKADVARADAQGMGRKFVRPPAKQESSGENK